MTLVLFGPPGVGKSTLVRKAHSLGFKTIDLEGADRVPSWWREYDVIGAGAFWPREFPGATLVLLLPQYGTYRRRKEARDKLHPEKRNQSPKIYWSFYDVQERYTHVIKEEGTAAETLRLILSLRDDDITPRGLLSLA